MKNVRPQFLFPVVVFLLLSLACGLPGNLSDDRVVENPSVENPSNQLPEANNPSNQLPEASSPSDQLSNANNPSDQQEKPGGFLKTDCNVSGVTFKDITVDYIVDDIYDGPYLICNLSTTGSKGLTESAYIRIVAYKAGPLLEYYQDLKSNIQGYVDQATEWNKQPDIPESTKDTITFLRDDSDGYIFMITKEANVQGCLNGNGFGVENIDGKYLIELHYISCEGDAGAYVTTLQNLQNAARDAIRRVEASAQP
jgi:hypothetical protein